MKILYYDCFAGISGDMNLGALIDLGVPSEYLTDELNKLNLEGYKIKVEKGIKMGISGTKVTVDIRDTGHEHAKPHQAHNHKHRNLSDIRNIINGSTLNETIKEKSLQVFHIIAEAEAKIHSKTLDEIHFHEVGAVDSIVDIVGSAICIDYLSPERILSSTVELGGGFVECAHGTYPVPAPATAEILKNIPVTKGSVDKETTTPTGAAILKAYVDEFTDHTNFTINKAAYGIGHHDLSLPNVLRVYSGETSGTGKFEKSEALLIECNIDDMNPEYYDYLIDKLFEAGAQDVFLVPIIMKKSRPAVQLKVLCSAKIHGDVEDILLTETTSLGLRQYRVSKLMLGRKLITVDTSYGKIRVK
ncbi:MAG: nickel pincer cofactor biosynthesis protein LarC, partial [Bacteroidales bacterium]